MSSNPVVVALVFIVLLMVTLPIARNLAAEEGEPRLVTLVMTSLGLRLICTFLQEYVVKHEYKGIADFTGYESQGAIIATGLHHAHLVLGPHGVTGDGTVNFATGLVFAITGANQIAGFAVFSWFALLGTIIFYRAFRIALPDADRFRYAVLLFLMPSLIFWTSAIGKEALMTPFLGLAANGTARLIAHVKGAIPRLAAGLTLATLERPNESVLVFVGLAVAFMVGRARRPGRAGPLGVLALGAVIAVGGFFMVEVMEHFLHLSSLSFSAVSKSLKQNAVNNSGTGAGFGSSTITYSPNPLDYFKDAYYVLFDPLPIQAHSTTQLLASLENVVVLTILLASLRRLWTMLRSCLREPYILLCLVYSLLFLYLFASLGNLGLIDRERTLLFPFMFVLVCLPSGRRVNQAEVAPFARWKAPALDPLVPATSRSVGIGPGRRAAR